MMSTTPGGGGSGTSNSVSVGAPPGKLVPRDILAMQSMLREMGINLFDVRILAQMHEFVYRFVTSVAEEARVYSLYGKKKAIDNEDIKLAVKVLGGKTYSTVPRRDVLLELAKTKNQNPLPLLKATSGLRLPPDRFCLTQPNYQLQFYRKAIAGSTVLANTRYSPGTLLTHGTSVPASQPVFKTPSAPLRSTQSPAPNSSGEPDAKKPKLMS